jgi:hypothetical protein
VGKMSDKAERIFVALSTGTIPLLGAEYSIYSNADYQPYGANPYSYGYARGGLLSKFFIIIIFLSFLLN